MAANPAQLDRRGPKIGDSASLWNFTPSPGWTREEVGILRLCLMKYGVGRWVQILDTGLLPGKLIQQLNGQTQRLLGQQSLAAVTGLQVDVDRIREDNARRSDVERKAGLIIWSGANPTAEMKLRWQKEAKDKYGLAPEQVKEAEQELEVVSAQVQTAPAEHMPNVSIMDGQLGGLSREQRLQLLVRLRKKLQALSSSLNTAARDCGIQDAQKPKPRTQAQAQQPELPAQLDTALQTDASTSGRAVGGSAAAQGKAAPGHKPIQGNNKATQKGRGSGPAAQPGQAGEDETDTADEQPTARPQKSGSKRSRAGSSAVRAKSAAPHRLPAQQEDSDAIAQLQAMGFSKAKAKEALQESYGDPNAATEWLLTNCT